MTFPERLRAEQATDIDHDALDALLVEHVDAAGDVDYRGLLAEREVLDAYLEGLAETDPAALTRDGQLAYYINAYNAATLDLILDNYPVASITDLDGGKPWDVQRVELGGQTYSLNEIENDIIRPTFDEPRIHFAVNCAAASCPPLRAGAFTADALDAQLEEQTRAFLNDPAYTRVVDGTAEVSRIFDWYGADFDDVAAFVARYRDDVTPTTEIAFAEYDWSLNEQ